MSRSSIYESAWLDLVFEGKNKAYGAYQLRRENSRTTWYAFALGLFFVASVVSIGLFLSSFGNKPTMNDLPILDDSIRVTKWENLNPPVTPPTPPASKKIEATPPDNDAKDMTKNPQIVETSNADDVKRNDAPLAQPEGPTGTGESTTTATSSATGSTDAPPAEPKSDGPIIVAALDRMPEFPGGINGFYKYVGDNFEKPEIDQTVMVLLSFVIEKDGTMTDIKVLRNPGYGLDKEAIRVLKSLKTKWKPGYKDGHAVRVLYQLPIKVTRN